MSRAEPYLAAVAPGAVDAWTQEAAKAGRKGSQRLLLVDEVPAPGRVASALNRQPGAPVILRSRLILLDDHPVEITDSYYPCAIAGGTALAEPQKIRGGAVSLLAELGYTPGTVTEEVAAREPQPIEQTTLRLDPGQWVLDVFRLLCSNTGEPYEVTTMTMPARGRTLRYTQENG